VDLRLAYLTLTHAKGLGPRKIKILVDTLGGARAVLESSPEALFGVEGIGPVIVKAILEAKQSNWPEQELGRADKLEVQIMYLEHPDYPEILKHIYDPPSILYMRGNLPTNPRAIGIVGTRNASHHALHFTQQLAKDLAEANVTVVSGLALGIDSAAHQGAVSVTPVSVNQGQTIAVLGSGVDVIYPRQNQKLAEKILDGHGAIVSEYPLGTQPAPTNFPGRNRIINGLSQGVVVVEAGEKSGALITSDYALEEGRTVFAVPGRVGDAKAKGTLGLLKQGAVLLESAQDIFNEFSWGNKPSPQPQLDLSAQEALIIKAIQALDSPLLDDLQSATSLPASELLPCLMMLELKSLVKATGGRYTLLIVKA
jgi:DNA processing protein